jgi:hypothetical protein
MTKKQQAALNAAKKAEKPLTIEQRIEQLKIDVQYAEKQKNQWDIACLKGQGALQYLEQMLKE